MVISTKAQRQSGDTAETTPVGQWLEGTPSTDSVDAVLTHVLEHPSQSLSSAHIVATAKAFQQLADMCRAPDVRAQLASSALAETSCALLQRTAAGLERTESRAEHVFLLVQLLRCICNQCADTDAVRAQVLRFGGLEALAKVLAADEIRRQPVPVAQAAFGAVLNVSLDYAECTQALLAAGALAPHVAVLRDGGALPVWPLVCSSLDNLCESDEAPAQFEQHAGLAQEMLQALADISQRLAANKAGGANGDDEDKNGDDEDTNSVLRGTQRTLLWILCEVLEKSGGVRQQLCQPACVLQLFGILEYYVTAGDAGESDEAQSPEDPAASAMAQPPNRPLPQSNRFADAAAQMIVGISGEDQALSMFDDTALQQRMFGLLQQSQEALAAAAALCLGNLARTDAHCTRLVADHADVVRAAVAWFERGEVRVRHAASGLLKNLCLPVSAKQQMVDFGLAAVAARSIDTAVVPVQANSIGILRHLIAGPAASVVRALLGSDSDSKSAGSDAAANSECALAKLLAAVRGTDIDGIRCEGTRLVAAVVKAVYLKRTVDARALEACGFDLVAPLVRLIVLDGQRHPLLQQESLVALSVLVPASTARAPYAETVVRLLGSTEGELPAIAELDSEDADEAKEAKEAAARPDSFATVLKRLLTQDGPVWPQSTMQAKSLVTQLAAKVDDTYDAAGLQAFNSEIIPLTLDK